MRIAVIGAGKVGRGLALAFHTAGLDVALGTRDPAAAPDGPVEAVGIGDALAGADTVVLAVTGTAVDGLLAEHGAALDGLLVVDATNRAGRPDGVLHNAGAVARHAPGARYARAFNSAGVELFGRPDPDGAAADLLFSADEADRAAVERLIGAAGLRPAYLGPESYADLDAALRLLVRLTAVSGRRHLGWRVITE
ncbi:NADPH-dependent F420 reductase [Kitasatospora sp. NPDC058201]|uniref:NADPH-dependent F420 reductase n=1 Tax=Streptomycetaceae TaxID=2062 RepID=UPI002E75A2AF|nr:NAD(P)-binding domain-containing protein [Streptomyces sp. BE303]MED7947996.1 NAD(P)-binding domain-containing protein [Streptomyces sp. BE303]